MIKIIVSLNIIGDR